MFWLGFQFITEYIYLQFTMVQFTSVSPGSVQYVLDSVYQCVSLHEYTWLCASVCASLHVFICSSVCMWTSVFSCQDDVG